MDKQLKERPMAARKKDKKPEDIIIPQLELGYIYARIIGRSTSPLVIKSMGGLADSLKDTQGIVGRPKPPEKGSGKKKPPRNPKEEFTRARYRYDNKRDGFPAGRIKQALVDTAYTFAAGVSKTLVRGAIYVVPGPDGHLVPIECEEGPVMREDIVRVGSKIRGDGPPDLRWRPQYNGWSIPIMIEYEKNLITPAHIFNLLSKAGYHVGIGEWRPQKGGTWGMFTSVADESAARNYKHFKVAA